jgi:prevent-host-death family protein
MSIAEDIRPISSLRTHAAELLDQVRETRRAVVITKNGRPAGVLQDVESYERLRKAVGLLRLIAQGQEDVRAGRTTPHKVVFEQIERSLKKRIQKSG